MATNPYLDTEDNKMTTTDKLYKSYAKSIADTKNSALSMYGTGAFGTLNSEEQELVAAGYDYQTYRAVLAAGGSITDMSTIDVQLDQLSDSYGKAAKELSSQYKDASAENVSAKLGSINESKNVAGAVGATKRATKSSMDAIDSLYKEQQTELFGSYQSSLQTLTDSLEEYETDIYQSAGTNAAEFETNMDELIKTVLGYGSDGEGNVLDGYVEVYTDANGNTNYRFNDSFRDTLGSVLFGGSIDNEMGNLPEIFADNPELYVWFMRNKSLVASALDLGTMDIETGKTSAFDPYNESGRTYTKMSDAKAQYEQNVYDTELKFDATRKYGSMTESGTNMAGANKVVGAKEYGTKLSKDSDYVKALDAGGWTVVADTTKSGNDYKGQDAKNWNFIDAHGDKFSVQTLADKDFNEVIGQVYKGENDDYYAVVYIDKDSTGKSEIRVVKVKKK